MVIVPEAHSVRLPKGDEAPRLSGLLKYQNEFLLPQMNVKQVAAIFDKTESEALAVISNIIERKIVRLWTESYTLRRYSEGRDRRQREVSGEI